MKPLAIDLYCGLGGWTEGLLTEGYRVIGFDIERHCYPRPSISQDSAVKRPGLNWSDRTKRGSKDAQFNRPLDIDPDVEWVEYPAQLVLQDVLTLHGRQFKDATLIVASPPCQAYSYRAMPWKRAKALPPPDNTLFEACFRIQREACEAAGRRIPMVVENVKGAQKWVGRAKWHYGSFYLWGDVPALMPMTKRAVKVPSLSCNPVDEIYERKGVLHRPTGHWTNPGENTTLKQGGSRKAASAMIAKIPFALAQYIAWAWKPRE